MDNPTQKLTSLPVTSTPIGKNFRRAKSIAPVTQVKSIERIVFWDTEADINVKAQNEEVHNLKLVVYRYLRIDELANVIESEYKHSFNVDEFVAYCIEKAVKDVTLYVICHNASYDVQISGIIRRLLDKGFNATKMILEFPPFMMTFTKGKHKIILLDNLNFARTSLASLGKSIGIEKYEYDYYRDGIDEELIQYAYRDVEILSEWFLSYYRFLVDNDLSPFAVTIAGQAFKTFRAKFLDEKIPLHREEDVLAIERLTYIGGRVECFRIGEFTGEKFYKLDINSMYPFVMRNRLYPTVYLGKRTDVTVEKLIDMLDKYYLIAEVQVSTDVPILPYRKDDRVIYPVGEFVTTLHHGELDLALKYVKSIKVLTVYVYKKEDIFSSYIDFFYKMKSDAELKGDKVSRNMAKLFMNSLYGKFGQVGYKDILLEEGKEDGEFYRISGYSEKLGKEVVITHINGKEYTTVKDGESFYSHPAIAGAVTSYARAYLAELLLTAGINNVYYSDTDSMIVNYQGYENVKDYIDNILLGYLKVEGIAEYINIRGLKDYVFGDEEKIKGVNKKAKKISNNEYINVQFRGAKTWLREGGEENVVVKHVKKTLKREYKKGIIQGSYVLPFILSVSDKSFDKSP